MQPEALARHIWPDGKLRVEPLGGGITNHNFKVSLDGEAYVLRIGGRDTELLGIDRRAEYAAARAAAEAGTGPEVVAFLEEEGALVTRFVAGRAIPVAEMRQGTSIAMVVAALRAFHDGKQIPSRFDSFRVVETYAAAARDRGVTVPAAYESAAGLAARIEQARGTQPLRPCHNDLLNANFILGGRLWIVDWEYAGMGDVFFDLANFSVNNELRPEDEDELLLRYFGERTDRAAAELATMRFMSDFREAMWGVLQQGISELDFDFRGYAEQHFERARHTAADRRFREAVRALESS